MWSRSISIGPALSRVPRPAPTTRRSPSPRNLHGNYYTTTKGFYQTCLHTIFYRKNPDQNPDQNPDSGRIQVWFSKVSLIMLQIYNL